MRILPLFLASVANIVPAVSFGEWKPIQSGVDYQVFKTGERAVGDNKIHVVRIDPRKATLRLLTRSAVGGETKRAGAWCTGHGLVVAMNAGMFKTDYSSNVGFMRSGDHINHGQWSKKYKSVLLFGPKKRARHAALVVDREAADFDDLVRDYDVVVQNLRLLKAPGRNVWQRSNKRWSEAAIAMDGGHRILLLFSRSPYPMHRFNRLIKKLPLDIQAAMHVEGGPEASLSIHGGDLHLDLSGSYETGFNENDDNRQQWPIPNVVGVVAAP